MQRMWEEYTWYWGKREEKEAEIQEVDFQIQVTFSKYKISYFKMECLSLSPLISPMMNQRVPSANIEENTWYLKMKGQCLCLEVGA